MITESETNRGYVGGNEQARSKPIWIQTKEYKQKSLEIYGNVTSRRVRKVESVKGVPLR